MKDNHIFGFISKTSKRVLHFLGSMATTSFTSNIPAKQQSRSAEKSPQQLMGNEHKISIVRQVEALHKPDDHYVDARAIFLFAKRVFEPAPTSQTVEVASLDTLSDIYDSLPEFPDLQQIAIKLASEIAFKVINCVDPHDITLSVLDLLQKYSWETKVVLTVTTFILTYGDCGLNLSSKSKMSVNESPKFMEHAGGFKHHFEATNNLIKVILETTNCIVEFEKLPPPFFTTDDPEVKIARTDFLLAVYWTVRAVVAAAAHNMTISSRGFDFEMATTKLRELSNWATNLKSISVDIRSTVYTVNRKLAKIVEAEDYDLVKEIVHQENHTDNMKVLNALISANDMPQLYDGSEKRMVHLNELKRKNVLLLISGLDIPVSFLRVLKRKYTELNVKSQYTYEIVWIPVDPVIQRLLPYTKLFGSQMEHLKASVPRYSVHPSMIKSAVIKFFREDWNFRGEPIIVVLDPRGQVLNANAIHMLWIWGSKACPFTKIREETLWKEESWSLELLVNVTDPKVLNLIREERYIFLFGGENIEWVQSFTRMVHEVAKMMSVPIEMVYVGRSDNIELVEMKIDERLSHTLLGLEGVWLFWRRIEIMINSIRQQVKVNDHALVILQELQRLYNHDKSKVEWAVLAKGSRILVNGHGKVALSALERFQHWKEQAHIDGFEVVYESHYRDLYRKEFPIQRIEFPAPVEPPQTMICPDCHNQMQNYVTCICYHPPLKEED